MNNKTFYIEDYSFNLLNKHDLKKILLIRNQKEVRDASFNTKIISENEHHKWFEDKIKKNFFHHYVLKYNEEILGLGYGENYSKKDRSCLWGFYINTNLKSDIKYGSLLKYLLFEKLFENSSIDQIRCQVKKDLEWIKNWHVSWGHQFINFDIKLNCYNLILKKKRWENIKYNIYNKGFKKNI
jgi:hypothetical protein